MGPDPRIRIIRRRNAGHANGQPGRQERIQGPDYGVAAGLVAIEAQHDLVDIALEHPGLVGRECGALRGHDIANPGRVAGDGVQLSLSKNGLSRVKNGTLGLVEGEEHPALAEDGRLGRIDVLGLLLVTLQHAPTEGDDPPLFIANREHQPPTEAIVPTTGIPA